MRCLLALPVTLATALLAGPPTGVRVDMAKGWLRRDWRECQDATRIETADGVVTFRTNRSAALWWQVPTLEGPARIGATESWVPRCSRPPLSFSRSVLRELPLEKLIPLQRLPRLTWRWSVENPVDDSRLAGPGGRIRREGDDFAAKLGILIRERDTDDVREVAYVWTRSIAVGTVLYQQSTIVPPFWKERFHRIVAQSGPVAPGRFVDENHDLRADFRRLYGTEPGYVVRLYLMSDADATGGAAVARFADVVFAP